MALNGNIVYTDGRYPFAAAAAQEPGDVIIRPSGTLAIYDGLNGCASGELISPCPIQPFPIAEFDALTSDTWNAGTVLYWLAASNRLTATEGSNKRVGVAVAAKTSGQVKALVECTNA